MPRSAAVDPAKVVETLAFFWRDACPAGLPMTTAHGRAAATRVHECGPFHAAAKKIPTSRLRSNRSSATLPAMKETWKYRGRVVTDAEVGFIRQLIAAHPALSRYALSRKAGTGCNPMVLR